MKNRKLLLFVLLEIFILGLSYCTKNDQVLNLVPAALNTDTLFSAKGTATLQAIGGAAWDGTIDPVWNSASKLTVHAVVPDLGNGTFDGYIGNSTDITIRALYDANNIYFLAEFDAAQKNVKSALWYFNPTTHLWAQEATAPVLNADGSYRPPAAQDQLVMMFNISSFGFKTLSCYALCHKETTFNGATTAGGYMYTNGPSERTDVWRARMLQVVNTNQLNDCFIDDGASVGLGSSGTLDKNEVHSDWQVNNGSSSSVPPQYQTAQAADGGFTNKQTLTVTGSATKVSVPTWVIPNGNYTNSAIMLKDTLPGGKALKVTAVSSTGILTLSDASTIDPNTATSGNAYQQVGSGDGTKCIPGSIVAAYTGSRGDVTANAYYTGTGWRVLIQRALKTSDTVNDVDFSSLNNQPFGIGAMFDGADNQHAIVAGLIMKFLK